MKRKLFTAFSLTVLAVLGSYLFAQAARERTALRLERVQVGLAALRQKVVARLGAEAWP